MRNTNVVGTAQNSVKHRIADILNQAGVEALSPSAQPSNDHILPDPPGLTLSLPPVLSLSPLY